MPLVQGTQPSQFGPIAHIPDAPVAAPAPSALDVAASAERLSNLGGSIYDRLTSPRPDAKAVPGFDPLTSIPAGYEPYADRFLDAESPEQITWIKGRIDSERNDQQTIARAGGWGLTASLAAGMTDPVTLASMAIPGGGETRLAQAMRLAAINAGTAAVQEGLQHELSPTRTLGDSALNVAGSAVLGGILGAAIRPRVPHATFDAMGENLSRELHTPEGGTSVLGPGQRSVLDTPLPSDHFEGPMPEAVNPEDMRATPQYVQPRPEGPTKPSPGNIPPIEPHRMSLLEAIAVTKGTGADTHGLSLSEATAQGLDPADLKSARFGARPVFTRGGSSFDAMAESLAQHGYPVTDERGAYSPNALLDAIDLELRGSKQYSPAAADYLAQIAAHERAASHAAQVRPGAEYEAELERDAAMAEARASDYTVREEALTDEQLQEFEGLRSHVPADEELGRARGGEPGQSGAENAGRARGEPLKVYRGASQELSAEHFDLNSLGRATGHPSSGLGVFFSQSPEEAARHGGVTEHYLDIRHPKIIAAEDLPAFDSIEEVHAYRETLRKQGYDGMVIDASHLGGPVNYVAFEPRQVLKASVAELNRGAQIDQAPNTVRFYHGGGEYKGGPRWLTQDRAYAEGYARKSGGKTYYVDIPTDHPVLEQAGKAFDDSGTGLTAPYNAFDAPPEIARDLKEVAPESATSEEYINPNAESTAGAAAVANPTMVNESIARGARTLASSPVGRVAPGLRVLTSDSLEARRLIQELANTPEMLEKNYQGIATPQPIERKLWGYEGVWWQALNERAQLFRAYRERMAGLDQPALSRREFGEQVSAAMRRGDQHEIPEVAQAAQKTRAIVFDPLKMRAMKLGLLPEDVRAEGADSYLTRQYDARKIRENLGKWLDTLAEGFRAQGVDPAEARDIAHKATRNVLGSERGTMDWHVMDDIVPESGRLKERTLKLPDTLLEPYLNSDIDHLSHSYLRSMAPEVEMTERFGSRDMKERLEDVKDDYARMMERAKARGEDPAPLEKQMNSVLRDLSAIRDRLYGLYGQPKDPGSFMVRAGRILRSDNALRLLGAATLAHFPDLANVIARYGMPNTFAAIGKVLTSSSAMNLTRNEAKRMGAALDMTMNVTASILGDYGSHSRFAEQRVMAKLTRGFTIATGETPLITAVQALTSTLAQDELLRSAEKVAAGKALSENLSARLAAAGLDEPMLRRIAEQGRQFTQKANGLRFGMSDKWTDQAAAQAFESAVLREAHGVTLRPGAGDTPLLMSGELGKLVLQFKTFAYAASRIVVNPLLQGISHADVNSIQGLFALAFMGTASYVSKQKAANQPIEWDNPKRLAMEVLDKSNLLGWTGEVIYPALWSLGMKDFSRWSDRDAVETIAGPSAGTVADIYERRFPSKIRADLLGGEDEKGLDRSDLHFVRRLMPGQNLWYFRQGVNALEDAVGNTFDLPGKSNADRAAERAAGAQ